MWFLLARNRGGLKRANIISLLSKTKMNMNKLAVQLGADYNTVKHHLKVLRKHGLVVQDDNSYGSLWSITPFLVSRISSFEAVLSDLRTGRKVVKPKGSHKYNID